MVGKLELQQPQEAEEPCSGDLQKAKSLICAVNFISRNLPLPPHLFDAVSSICFDEQEEGLLDTENQVESGSDVPELVHTTLDVPSISEKDDLLCDLDGALSKQRSKCMSGFSLAESKENRYQSHIHRRLNELEDLPSSRGEDLQTKCLLELYGLKLAELQSKIRSYVSTEYWLHAHCAYPDKQLFDWGMTRLPFPPYGIFVPFTTEADDQTRKKRDYERVSRLREEERNHSENRKKKFFSEIVNAFRDFQLQIQATLKRRKQRNDGVQLPISRWIKSGSHSSDARKRDDWRSVTRPRTSFDCCL